MLLCASACSDGGNAQPNSLFPSPSTDPTQPGNSAGTPFLACQGDALDVAALHCQPASGMGSAALAVCSDLTADNTLEVDAVGASGSATALWVGGRSETSAPLTVHGDFIANAGNDARNTQSVSGSLRSGVPLACDRAPSLAPFVASLDVQPGHITVPTTQTLASCRYLLSNLTVDNTLSLRISGHVSLLISGDVHIAAPTQIVLEPGASLDWIIGGALEIDNTLAVGDATRPEASLVAVAGALHVAAPTQLDGSLYAPKSAVEADNTLAVSGAAYVGSLHVAAPMVVQGHSVFSADGCSL